MKKKIEDGKDEKKNEENEIKKMKGKMKNKKNG